MNQSTTYLLLAGAIIAEVTATTALSRSESFTRLIPSIITILGYASSFVMLSFPIRVMPTGIIYAVWSGAGIVLIAAIGWLRFGQKLDTPALIGLTFIITGVVIVNVFSKTIQH
jgi:small multidrug resistance pump